MIEVISGKVESSAIGTTQTECENCKILSERIKSLEKLLYLIGKVNEEESEVTE